MKVLYDYQAFTMQRFGGVSNCFVQLIKNLPSDCEYMIGLKQSNNVHLSESHLMPFSPSKITIDHFRGKVRLMHLFNCLLPGFTDESINQRYSIELLKEGDFDIFHPTFFNDYFLYYLHKKPFVLTVHDMIPELFWGNLKREMQIRNKKKLCDAASHIIAVSEKTKQDLCEMLHVHPNKVTVIYHASHQQKPVTENPIIKEKYLLYIGARIGYKNFIPMVRSLSQFLYTHKDFRLVCTGPSFTKEEGQLFNKLGISDQIIHYGASDKEMPNLYHYAQCFIYPSLYEGFGIPILEAYEADCPVLLNTKSCFPEIAQQAAVYFTLDSNKDTLVETLNTFLSSFVNREIIIQKQSERLLHFSWEKSAHKLNELYLSLT